MGEVVAFPAHRTADRWLTKRELAHHWNVAPRTIERYMRAGLPNVYRNGKRRFTLSDAEHWREEREAV